VEELIFALRDQSLPEEAERIIAKGLAQFPKHLGLRYAYATLFYDRKKFTEAIEAYDKALEIDPKHLYTTFFKAQSLRMLGRGSGGDKAKLDEAERVLDAAFAHYPDDPLLLKERGWLHFDKHQYESSFNCFVKAEDFSSLQSTIYQMGLRGHAGEAERLLQKALTLYPGRPEVLLAGGELRLSQKSYDEADQFFARVQAIDPQNKTALGNRIFLRRAQQRFKEAEEMLREPLRQNPEDPVFLNERGAQFYDQRQFDKAVEQFQKVLAKDEGNEFALQWILAALRWEGRGGKPEKFAEAERLMEKALARFPEHEGILIERGWLSFEQDRFAQADEAFAKAANLAVDPRQANFGRIDALTRNKRGDEVAKIIDSLKQAYPNDPDVLERAGWYYIGRNDLDNAKKEFESILKNDPKNILGLNGIASVYFTKGEFEEAEEMYREALKLAEHDPTFHTNLAWALVRQDKEDDFAEAEKSCRRALELSPNYSAAYGCLGVIAFRRGRVSESEDYLLASTRASARDGNYTDLGALYVQMARYEDAEATLKTALEINPYDTQALIQRGNLYLAQQKTKEAVREFRRATVVDKWSEEASRMLATALMSAGEYGEAERVLRDSIKRLDEHRRWQLHLRLSELLVSLGDEKKDAQYYEDALSEAAIAKRLNRTHAEPYFHEGIALAKLKDYLGAAISFDYCIATKDDHYDARRNQRLVRAKIREERILHSGSKLGAAIVGGAAAIQLIALWIIYMNTTGKVTDTMMMTMIPILLGLIVISLLLPVLVKLKLPGVEAELSQSQQKEPISSGPKGEIGFGSSSSIISPKAR
jgi:tetratricopeptide (TPR) repeat protein